MCAHVTWKVFTSIFKMDKTNSKPLLVDNVECCCLRKGVNYQIK